MASLTVTHLADPGCPWAYSALPAVTTLRWRYGSQIGWKIATIGLTESGSTYEERGYTSARMAATPTRFGRFGMPYVLGPRSRVLGTGRACRAIVAARELYGEARAYSALRALSLGWFTSELMLDEDADIERALAPVEDAAAIVAALGDPAIEEAYQRDRALARSAAGSPSALQERTAQTDGPERYTAPTLFFETNDGRRLEAGGHQPLAAYDLAVANLAPSLDVRAPAEDPLDVLSAFEDGLTTREIAQAMAGHDEEPDDASVTGRLLEHADSGAVTREPFGANALWRATGVALST